MPWKGSNTLHAPPTELPACDRLPARQWWLPISHTTHMFTCSQPDVPSTAMPQYEVTVDGLGSGDCSYPGVGIRSFTTPPFPRYADQQPAAAVAAVQHAVCNSVVTARSTCTQLLARLPCAGTVRSSD